MLGQNENSHMHLRETVADRVEIFRGGGTKFQFRTLPDYNNAGYYRSSLCGQFRFAVSGA